MYLVLLHGHGTSACPGASGTPTECTHRTNDPDSSIAASAAVPIRVMIRIETTTYGESVISTPSREMLLPSGPMQNGTTYMVRPAMHPAKISAKVWRISSGAIQLFVGPASASRSEQMNVRSSTRATSPGSDRHQKLFGRSLGFSRVKVPFSTSRSVSRSHSACDPSHHTTASGLVSSTISPTQAASSGRLVSAEPFLRSVVDIAITPAKQMAAQALPAYLLHNRGAINDWLAALIRHGRPQFYDPLIVTFLQHRHHDMDGIADLDGSYEPEILAEVNRIRSGKPSTQHGRDKSRNEHARGNPLPEH